MTVMPPLLRMRKDAQTTAIQKNQLWRLSLVAGETQTKSLTRTRFAHVSGRTRISWRSWWRPVRESLQSEAKVFGKGSGSQTLQHEAAWKRIIHPVRGRSLGPKARGQPSCTLSRRGDCRERARTSPGANFASLFDRTVSVCDGDSYGVWLFVYFWWSGGRAGYPMSAGVGSVRDIWDSLDGIVKHKESEQVKSALRELVIFWAAQMAEALRFLHQCSIIYSDFSTHNFVMGHDLYIRLIDFGKSFVDAGQELLSSTFKPPRSIDALNASRKDKKRHHMKKINFCSERVVSNLRGAGILEETHGKEPSDKELVQLEKLDEIFKLGKTSFHCSGLVISNFIPSSIRFCSREIFKSIVVTPITTNSHHFWWFTGLCQSFDRGPHTARSWIYKLWRSDQTSSFSRHQLWPAPGQADTVFTMCLLVDGQHLESWWSTPRDTTTIKQGEGVLRSVVRGTKAGVSIKLHRMREKKRCQDTII